MKKLLFYTIFLALISLNAIAQPAGPNPPPPPPDPDDVPIDGGLSFLVAGGIAYGAYQYKKRKQDKEEDSL